MKRKWKKQKIHGGILGVIISIVLVGVAICILGVAIISLLIGEQVIKPEAAGYGLVATLLLASFIVVRMSIQRGKGNQAVSAALGAGIVLCTLIAGNLILGAGNLSGIGQTALVILAGSGCALILKRKPERSKKYRIRKR